MDTAKLALLSQIKATFVHHKKYHSHQLMLDNHKIEIRATIQDLLHTITKALTHLSTVDKKEPELIVEIFVGKAGKISAFLSHIKNVYGSGLVRANCKEYSFFYNPGLGGSFASLNFFDKTNNRAIYWIQSIDKIPWYEYAAPLRVILRWFFATINYILLHGATVVVGDRGLLLIGPGGKGKTTTALTALDTDGLNYLSDDYTLVKLGAQVTAHSLYSTAKVRPSNQKNDVEQTKEVLYLSDRTDKLAISTTVTALVIPEIGHRNIRWEKISPVRALIMLAPSTLMQLFPEDNDKSTFGVMVSLTKNLPAYTLRLNQDKISIGKSLYDYLTLPVVSVILPAYNAAPYIQEAINSVKIALQDVPYEIIVVDDGSTDATNQIIKSDKSLKYHYQNNAGPAAARNRGIKLARGEYIAFIDADDVWTSDHYEYLYRLITSKSEYQVAMGYTQRHLRSVDQSIVLEDQDIYGPPILMPSFGCALFKRQVFDSIGDLNSDYHWHEDVDWYLRLREQNVPVIIGPKIVKHYRLHTTNITISWNPTDTQIIKVLHNSLTRREGREIKAIGEGRPLISIILCVYNAAEYLEAAISSIHIQDYKNVEIIAIDDGSIDGSLKILRAHPEIRTLTQEEQGESKTRNRGIRESLGEYISFLDPDDLYYPGRLSQQLIALQASPESLMNTSLCLGFMNEGLKQPSWVRSGMIDIPHKNLSPSGWMIHRSLFETIGYMDESLNSGCDFEWIKRVKKRGHTIGLVNEVLWGKRVHTSNASAFIDKNKIKVYHHELLKILKEK